LELQPLVQVNQVNSWASTTYPVGWLCSATTFAFVGLAPKGLIPSDLRHITSTKALRIGAKWYDIVSGSGFWGAPYLVGLSYNYYYVNQDFPRDANQLWHS
jgi:hypothetical protein